MFIRSENEIISLMPTARWSRVSVLFGYIEEEERLALEPLLGSTLYSYLCDEYERLTGIYSDITSSTIKPTKKAKEEPSLPYADVTERIEQIHVGMKCDPCDSISHTYDKDVSEEDMQTIRLLRICQQIEFYMMLSHKSGMLTVSFNDGGGMNMVSADGYDVADDKRLERLSKDAYMSAGRAIDSLLLFLESDAKDLKLFTEKWKEADSFYLHKDLLFQTARELNEYLDIHGDRRTYISLVRDIRYCQSTYLKPRIGWKLLRSVTEYANNGSTEEDVRDVYEELLQMLRTALAFYVESRRTESGIQNDKLARRDSMTDAQQAMAMACQYVEEHIDELGDAVKDSPIYNSVRDREQKKLQEVKEQEAFRFRQLHSTHEQSRKKLFTGFPATHRAPEHR